MFSLTSGLMILRMRFTVKSSKLRRCLMSSAIPLTTCLTIINSRIENSKYLYRHLWFKSLFCTGNSQYWKHCFNKLVVQCYHRVSWFSYFEYLFLSRNLTWIAISSGIVNIVTLLHYNMDEVSSSNVNICWFFWNLNFLLNT